MLECPLKTIERGLQACHGHTTPSREGQGDRGVPRRNVAVNVVEITVLAPDRRELADVS
jgi:hypothetical protein